MCMISLLVVYLSIHYCTFRKYNALKHVTRTPQIFLWISSLVTIYLWKYIMHYNIHKYLYKHKGFKKNVTKSIFVLYVLCSVLPHCRSFIPNVVLYHRKGNETRETIFDVSVENKTCPCLNRKYEVKNTKEITCLLPHVFEIDPQAQVTWRNVRHYHKQNYCNRNDLNPLTLKG